MKFIKVLTAFLILAILITVLSGCGAAKTTAITTQEASVTRGNLVNEISAAGNLAFSQTQDLPVDLFYPTGTKGTIGEVLVQAGDSVKKGQVLVTIDKTEWNSQLASLQDTVTSRQMALTQAQINLMNAQQAVITANETITAKQQAVLNAEIALTQAQTTFNGAITNVDFTALAEALNKAKAWYEYVTVIMPQKGVAVLSPDYDLALEKAQQQLDAAQSAYDAAVSGYNSTDIYVKSKQLEVAQNTLTAAQLAVTDAQNNIPLTQLSLTLSQGNLQNAQEALTKAQEDVTNAEAMSPEILAPFDGIITAVGVAGGDQVLNGTIAVTMADPNKFEAEILVSEMDITSVKVGNIGTVVANAFPSAIMTANVTYISPTATISSGVVNYDVKVEVQPPGKGLATLFGQSGNVTRPSGFSGTGNFQRSGGTGTTPSSGTTTTPSNTTSGNQNFGQAAAAAAAAAANVQLREGLSVTVSIVIASATNILMVPNGAITTQNGNSYVEVIGADGKTVQTKVTTGISNYQFTEIKDGLTEGQKIKVSLNVAPTNTNNRQGNAGFLLRG